MLSYGVIFALLVQIFLILAVCRAMGWVCLKLRQPQVVGEMLAGIMLGPSLFGLLAPALQAAVFPAQTVPLLNILSQIGVVFFLFLVGLELDPKLLRNRGHTAVVVSHVSIVAPFLLGAALTLYLYPRVFNDSPGMRFTASALFMGAAMSITAFPVLARILTERNLHKTNIGAVSITCAAVDDVTAWCMLAFVVGVVRATGVGPGLATAGLAVVYVLVMLFAVRPLLAKLGQVYDREGRLSQAVVAIIFLLVLGSAATTEWIGIHALFGAFMMGAVMPKGTKFVRHLSEKLEDFTVVFLLPIFFAYTGLKTQIGLISNAELWVDTGLIIAVAVAGKFGGSSLAGRLCGLSWREASAVGVLMNTRGLMELVILNIGLAEGVITPAVFAMMVIMALVTTAMTSPLLSLFIPARDLELSKRKPGDEKRFGILIPVANPTSGGGLLQMAAYLAGPDLAKARLNALHLKRPVDRDAYRAGLDEAPAPEVPVDELAPLLAEAAERDVHVEPITFFSRDVPSDIARVARAQQANLVLMGFHKAVFSKTILGGVVHRVLTGTDADVAVFVERDDFHKPRKILVPYAGSAHDRRAMELAGRVAQSTGATITVLHVIAPTQDKPLKARENFEQTYTDPALRAQVTLKVITSESPIDTVLSESNGDYDLVVVGVDDEWGLETHLFGFRPERIAAECPASLLLVRRYEAAPLPVVSTEPALAGDSQAAGGRPG
jgi:Kef-type K+ transport system membrane component KefB/nucleotide-binding universal stress UspA family protein